MATYKSKYKIKIKLWSIKYKGRHIMYDRLMGTKSTKSNLSGQESRELDILLNSTYKNTLYQVSINNLIKVKSSQERAFDINSKRRV